MVRKQTNVKGRVRRISEKGAPKHASKGTGKPAKDGAPTTAKPTFGRRSGAAGGASHRATKERGGPFEFLRRLNPF